MASTPQKAFHLPVRRLGVIGAGQLGRMMIYRAKPLGLHVSVLDASPDAPAASLADRFVRGDLYDPDALAELAGGCDVLTCEIEHFDVDAVERLSQNAGVAVHPAPRVLRIIQDKLIQKQTLEAAGVPVPRFDALPPAPTGEASNARPAGALVRAIRSFGFPCVQKARHGGYDGRGVAVLPAESDINSCLGGETMIEEQVDIRKEVAVLIARDRERNLRVYPLVEMVFDPVANVLTLLRAPARVPDGVRRRSVDAATGAVEALGGVGIFAVELFWTDDDRILVNEVAPRPHNSGHFSIEACVTDQFEQHIRAVCGLPLGATDLVRPAAMINLLGAGNAHGAPVIHGLREVLALPGVKFHWYGKSAVRPYRKMGHVTVLAEDAEEAAALAARVAGIVRIGGTQEEER